MATLAAITAIHINGRDDEELSVEEEAADAARSNDAVLNLHLPVLVTVALITAAAERIGIESRREKY